MKRVLALVAIGLVVACSASGTPQSSFGDDKDSTETGNGNGSPDGGGTDAGQTANTPDATIPEEPVIIDAGTGDSPVCIKVADKEVTCDGKDDDCDGEIDNLDVGKDGICDCIRIGIVGKPGYYASVSFQNWLVARGTTVTRVQHSPSTGDKLTAAQLQSFDMVIFDWLEREYSDTEAQVLKDWMEAGHGFLALSGFAESYPVAYPNSLLKTVNLAFTGADTIRGAPGTTIIREFLRPYPLTEQVLSVSIRGSSTITDNGWTGPGIHQTFATLTPPVGLSATIGLAHDTPKGKAVAWGDEWIEFDSEWSALPDIPRFWANIVSFLAPRCKVPPPPTVPR